MLKIDKTFTEDDIGTTADFNEIENKIKEVNTAIIGSAEGYSIFSPQNTYNIGDIVAYNNNLYRCTKAINTPSEWTGVERVERRTIKVGDNLSNKKLYFSFPPIIQDTQYYTLLSSNNGRSIDYLNGISIQNITLTDGSVYYLATYNDFELDRSSVLNDITLSNDFGIITQINENDDNHIFETITADFDEGNWEEYDSPLIPTYEVKTWEVKDYLLYTYLNNIETGIKNIGKYYYRPYGWQDTKTWTGGMSFSYRDLNRWINNLNIVIERLNNESNSLFPSDTLYPSETLLPH